MLEFLLFLSSCFGGNPQEDLSADKSRFINVSHWNLGRCLLEIDWPVIGIKAPNPKLLPGHRSINGCPLLRVCVHCMCVFTAVCMQFGWVNCRAQIPSMGHHTWPYLYFTYTYTLTFTWITNYNILVISILTLSIRSPKAVSSCANMPSKATNNIWPALIFGVSCTELTMLRGWINSEYWARRTLTQNKDNVQSIQEQ